MRASALLVLVVFAGCGKDDGGSSSSSGTSSSSRRIEGGTEVTYQGVQFDIPKTWRSEAKAGGLHLQPDGADINEEVYLMGGDMSTKTFDAEKSETWFTSQLQGATKKSGPDSRTFGEVDGKEWRFSLQGPKGEVEIRAWGWQGSCACGLMAIGFPNVLAKRENDIKAILGSMRKVPAPPAGAEGVRPELAGTWVWISNVHANNGGRMTDTKIILSADGTYQYRYEHVSSNPFGASWSNEFDQGTWTATDTSITWKSQNGSTQTQTLEKRNHPKNTGDPMIVLDGKTFVTATRRDPW